MRGGPALGAESEGGLAVRCLRTSGIVELAPDDEEDEGGDTLFPDDEPDDGEDGGFEVALMAEAAPLEPAAPDTPELPAAADKARAPATAEPTPVAAIEPTATALPARNAEVPTRSPPVSAGDPPSTAENNFGICQQSIMKMMEAPIISSADIAGLELEAILSACVIQSVERFMPVPISR
jgi:hypothetical protein